MKDLHHPSKQQVRDYMTQRRSAHCPPPDIKEIRRQLGWDLVPARGTLLAK